MDNGLVIAGLCGILSTLLLLRQRFVSRRKQLPDNAHTSLPLPPGPKPLPILGNIRDLDMNELWLKAEKWARQYGEVAYLHVFGQGLVFLNSPEATSDLLTKALYADKPKFIMAGELCGCDNMVAFTPYGDKSRRQRRLLTAAFGIPTIPAYHPLITSQTHSFLRHLISSPANYVDWIKNYAGSLTLSVVYGYQIKNPKEDELLLLADETVDLLANKIAGGGGLWPVDLIPALKYWPEWLPGGAFKKSARTWKAKLEECVEKPFEFLTQSMKSGSYLPSFCSNILQDSDPAKQTDEFIFDLKWTANSMYASSIDTTLTVVLHFMLAMMNHPEKMRKAQEEIDRVVGTSRLPAFEDRKQLPYVDALLSEIYRWGVPVPLNLPHRLTEDDVYNGMRIPKGSLVFGNVWAICRDPKMYPSPEEFIPERFLEECDDELLRRKREPRNYVFGFGRRRCPGVNLVESSVWLLVASMLATLDISKARDERTGETVEPKLKFENAVFRIPNAFECDIRPRSAHAVHLIRETEIEAA